MYVERWDRALRFLLEYGHEIGSIDGVNVIVDRKTYPIIELPTLADRLHPDEWLAAEHAFVERLLAMKPTPDAQGD